MVLRREKEVVKESYEKADSPFYRVFQSSPESDLTIKGLYEQLTQKTRDLERLRKYVTQLEEGEKGLVTELTRQLAQKDEEITRVSSLYSKKEAENRKLSESFEAHIASQREHAEKIKFLLLKKEQENGQNLTLLRKELEQKDAEISSLRGFLMENSRQAGLQLPKTGEEQVPDTQKQLETQITEMRRQISQLTSFITEKEKLMRSLESVFESRLAAKDEELQQLKRELGETTANRFLPQGDEHTASIVKGLKRELESRDLEVTSLRDRLMRRDKPVATHDVKHLELEKLKEELESKSRHLARAEKALAEEQKLAKSSESRLKEQISAMETQMDELKSFLIEKEKLVQNLYSAFERRIAAKEDEIRHLKTGLSRKPEVGLRSNAEKLEAEIQVKEEAAKIMAEEIARLREQSGLLRKRLEERQRLYFESEKAYEELIAKLREQHDSRAKALLQEASQKEAALSTALEEERARIKQERAVLKEKERQIEETLLAFNSTSQKLIALGGSAPEGSDMAELAGMQKALDEKKKYLEAKEEEIKGLLASTEEKIAELKTKEATIERKEQLLLQEQEALNKELEVLTSAGVEISRSKEYIKQKLQEVGSAPEQQMQSHIQLLKKQPAPQTFQPSAQSLGFEPTSEVQEAQEEEGMQSPKFPGIATQTQVQEAPSDAISEENSQESVVPAVTIKKTPIAKAIQKAPAKIERNIAKAAPKGKAKVVPKRGKKAIQQQKQKIIRTKPAAAKTLPQKPVAAAKPVQAGRPTSSQAPTEMAIGARDAAAHTEQELFTEMGGYSELDEIKSVVDVGLQHGDSIEQIKESLLTSGYSKQNIEKVLSGIRK